MALSEGAEFELTVDRLAAGGDAVARGPGGITVFVPLAAPGDRLRVRVTEVRRRFLRAEVVEVISAGPARVAPRCQVFGRCGGCAWQHLDYAAQLEAKRGILADALRRIGRHDLAAMPDVMASPEPYGYRARARLLGRDGVAGYRARRSHTLCPAAECPVLVPGLEPALAEVRRRTARDRALREWQAEIGSDGRVRIAEMGESVEATHEDVADADERVGIAVGGDVVALSSGSFGQANALLWDALHARVVEAAGRGERVLELYAGAGFFTLALARRFGRVEAVESSRTAVDDLRRNLARADLDNVDVMRGRVDSVVPRRVTGRPDVVVLDPPRTGVSAPVAQGIAKLSPRRIVYLSCDPATLARDTARMVEAGYALVHAEGFDLFPQTAHLEALAVLERSSSSSAAAAAAGR